MLVSITRNSAISIIVATEVSVRRYIHNLKIIHCLGLFHLCSGLKPLASPPTQVKSQFKLPFPSLSRVGLGRLNIAPGLLLCQGHFLHPPGGVILSSAPPPPLPETIFFGHLGVTFTAVLCQEQYILSFYMYKVPEASYLSSTVAGAVFDDESTKCSH